MMRRIRLLPDAHATVHKQHLAVHVFGSVAKQKYGGAANNFGAGHDAILGMKLHLLTNV